MRRTQIYLDAQQHEQLANRAKGTGSTSSSLIREAVASYLADEPDADMELARQRQALREAFAAAPLTRLPSGSDYVDDLRKADRQRDEELDRQWRRSG